MILIKTQWSININIDIVQQVNANLNSSLIMSQTFKRRNKSFNPTISISSFISVEYQLAWNLDSTFHVNCSLPTNLYRVYLYAINFWWLSLHFNGIKFYIMMLWNETVLNMQISTSWSQILVTVTRCFHNAVMVPDNK